jgi:hypothetical protein
MPGIGQSIRSKETHGLTGCSMLRMLISMFLGCHLNQKLELNSMKKLLKISSTKLKDTHMDITTSYSDGLILQSKTGHLSFLKDSCQSLCLFSQRLPQHQLTVFIFKPLTRDSEHQASQWNKLLPKLLK